MAFQRAIHGLTHHVETWEADGDPRGAVLLVHGAKDRGCSFDDVGPALAARGWNAFAPDMRGYGRSDDGRDHGGYQLERLVGDIAGLVDAVAEGSRVFLVGHSFGGVVCTLYAGAFPERVGALAIVDGLGAPYEDEASPERLRAWVLARRREARKPPRRVTMERAVESLMAHYPEVDRTLATRRAAELTVEADGGRRWYFDPLHWSTLFDLSTARWQAHAKRVEAPVLVVYGTEDDHRSDDERRRLASFAQLTEVGLAGGGHMVHWTRPRALARALADFGHEAMCASSST